MAFYIISKNGVGDVFEMDATVTQNYALRASPTEYAVESGSKSSDHYDKQLIRLNYSGVVSDVKYLKGVELSQSVADFEEGMQALFDSGEFFACNFSEEQRLVKNCLFTSLQVVRNLEHGRYAIKVDFSVKQVKVANVSEVESTLVPFATFEDPSEEKKSGAGSTQQPDERELDALDRDVSNLTFGAVERVNI